jgi:hypothetical protein
MDVNKYFSESSLFLSEINGTNLPLAQLCRSVPNYGGPGVKTQPLNLGCQEALAEVPFRLV